MAPYLLYTNAKSALGPQVPTAQTHISRLWILQYHTTTKKCCQKCCHFMLTLRYTYPVHSRYHSSQYSAHPVR
ncbi:Protein of unknown function [Pyronema omphalodes CBS 100304]|uniref:Uncharacterized protein n=1 Tax=Pyronema omphalodes (strain CBS 100304) TaxID=1076935 RepID=U4LUZ2_PYROM|nr:Protein of unknown function [Pyronema omphalodes CBS 100304]